MGEGGAQAEDVPHRVHPEEQSCWQTYTPVKGAALRRVWGRFGRPGRAFLSAAPAGA